MVVGREGEVEGVHGGGEVKGNKPATFTSKDLFSFSKD